MFAVTPRMTDDFGLLRLVDELVNPWDLRTPMMYRDGTLANLSGRLGDSEIQNTDKEFRIRLDLRHYSPEEVKITSDNKKITIKAKHEEKQDNHGYVSREMIRTYALPDDVDPKSVTSVMNTQGTLNIKVAKKPLEAPKEIAIPVEFKK
ncbi:heat shock protein Hsp-12.2 [Biomphalaria glabrata]|uniref:Heat shock protein Hsp-12.2-like n=1 Tax=Biomphalaria glabrata TaxID=6526 RepID=A0A9U8EJH2_BIOGL|nr:heat shock protein Hsp-12.2-like [Biomphalaria glabrata]XP_055864354.1 heat shock protein Hsp-12.2-like [Biomphalaria glabrata]KAI8736309.1 heat shock protein Hsp-12.2-like [Biomphalaria glabrata]KAI8796119.1 heat shock protein Hsp-12.2 [Biomphalaria glabrata]